MNTQHVLLLLPPSITPLVPSPDFEPILINLCFRFLLLLAAKLDGVKTYMRMRRVPNHLQVKVIKWFDYLWLTQKCSDEERAVSCLPDKLKVSCVHGFCIFCIRLLLTFT